MGNQRSVRAMVRARDNGICALCGVDTLEVHRFSSDIMRRANDRRPERRLLSRARASKRVIELVFTSRMSKDPLNESERRWFKKHRDNIKECTWRAAIIHATRAEYDSRRAWAGAMWLAMADSYGWARHRLKRQSEPWDADHTVPLSRGGSPSMDNIRTLCLPCHKRETARLKARRDADREETKQRMNLIPGGRSEAPK